jgi:hypothetical protein
MGEERGERKRGGRGREGGEGERGEGLNTSTVCIFHINALYY